MEDTPPAAPIKYTPSSVFFNIFDEPSGTVEKKPQHRPPEPKPVPRTVGGPPKQQPSPASSPSKGLPSGSLPRSEQDWTRAITTQFHSGARPFDRPSPESAESLTDPAEPRLHSHTRPEADTPLPPDTPLFERSTRQPEPEALFLIDPAHDPEIFARRSIGGVRLDPEGNPIKEPEVGYNLMVARVFSESFDAANLDFDDLYPFRLKAVWRIVREIARTRKLVAPGQFISEALKVSQNGDPWTRPQATVFDGSLPADQSFEVVKAIRRIDQFADSDTPGKAPSRATPSRTFKPARWMECRFEQGKIELLKGSTLLPPSPGTVWSIDEPLDTLEDDNLKRLAELAGFDTRPGNTSTQAFTLYERYNPEEDKLLMEYIRLIDVTAKHLGIRNGSAKNTNSGKFGMAGLLEPRYIRSIFPSAFQIMYFESLMAEETLELMVEKGRLKTKEILRFRHGFQKHEIESLLAMAMSMALEMTNHPTEENRALMVLRLENYAQRAQEACNLQAELHALNRMAMVQGLTEAPEESNITDFCNIMKKISNENNAEKVLERKRVENTLNQHSRKDLPEVIDQ